MLNISARTTRIYIGEKDFSSCFISFQGSDSHIDQSGLIAFTGSIVLGRSLGFDESLDDRKNSRFFRGQTITIEIQDSQGVFRKHPRGSLRIISSKYDDDSKKLTIDVGDLISLLNFREPTDSSKTEIKLGTNTTTGQVIQNLLTAAGISAIGGTLPNTIINYPINLTGSYLANAGKLLYANNLFAWIDKNEVFQVRTANIAASTPAVTIVIGRDEIWYKRLDSAESPCEVVKAVGRCVVVKNAVFRNDTSEQYGAAILVDKNAGYSEITIKRTTILEEWFPGQKLLKTTTTTKQPIGLVIPKEILPNTSPKLSLITSEIRIDKTYFEQNGEGKLKKKTTSLHQLLAPSILEYAQINKNYIFNIFSLTEAADNSYSYEYDNKDRLTKITTKSSEIAGNLLSGTDEDWSKWLFPPDFLAETEYKVEQWEEATKGIWEYEYFSYQPLIKVKPDLVESGTETGTQGPTSNKLDMIYASGDRQTSNSGQLAPAAPEREPPLFTMEEEDIEEKITFTIPGGGSNLRPRERIFSVDCLAGVSKRGLKRGEVEVSFGGGTAANNQLKAIARREGNLLWGRYKGQQIAIALTDAWFDYHPLFNLKTVEKDGTQQAFLADGCSWVVGQSRVLVSCDGVWLGSWQTGATEDYVSSFYNEVDTLNMGMGMGINFIGYAYALSTTTVALQVGIGLGCGSWIGSMSQLPGTDLQWSNLDWDDISDWDSVADDNYWEAHSWDSLSDSSWDALNNLSYWETTDWESLDWENVV
ncbi:hypothetical protein VF14_03615 [Nostoc linckia z18]|uniref:Uncharacterized protein n=2 Tax=Nostoc linckia TaxID=92942 RepID=A0A9Q5ZH46_NOSLI|nr:hypothetical protein [Nostoc linckia]PHK41462.1 hypothetical protein VF12_06600 [Nostoc linckia z15]PHK46963.1 hypothetical protein VF13_08260 [Nostoc linckia z16]PHJ69224.1 hypothetical protein VF02_01085 [Nostoc linckia z1]PHJ73376.1 hypothetical protein VF05_02105 [Nostoc linckia z3]PHJ78723.1 hypothetical protein VF03_01090 [Nostoc linckia z2]